VEGAALTTAAHPGSASNGGDGLGHAADRHSAGWHCLNYRKHSDVPLLEKCLAYVRTVNEPLAVATCQFYLGQIEFASGRVAEAITALRESLELATQAGETDMIAPSNRCSPLRLVRLRDSAGTSGVARVKLSPASTPGRDSSLES
jgi:hypothetical protein